MTRFPKPLPLAPTLRLAILLLLTALLMSGCVSKSQLEEAQVQVQTCEEDKAVLEAKVAQWEDRFDRESSRWSTIETSVTEAMPRALDEFHAERKRILDLVPEQVHSEVETYLEDYFTTVMQGFQVLSQDNSEIKLQLETTQKVIEQIGARTQNIGADTAAINQAIDEALAEEQAKVAEVSAQLSAVIEQIAEFDQTRINCKNCPDKLRLNRREREAVLGLHGQLTTALSQLQSVAGSANLVPDPADEPEATETAPDGADS